MGFALGLTPLGGPATDAGMGVLPLVLGGASAPVGTPTLGVYYVTASSGFRLHGTADAYKSPIDVSASTTIRLAASVALASRFWEVSAASSFRIGPSASLVLNSAINVAAATSFAIGSHSAVTLNHSYAVAAATSFRLHAGASNTRICVAAASTSFSIHAGSTSGRDLHVSASTGLGLSSTPKSNGFFAKAATSSFTIHAAAGVHATGPSAASGFVLTDLATAVVWMPWRPAGLTRPPGGNQPHS